MTKWVKTSRSNTDKTVYHTEKDCVKLEKCRPVSDAEIDYHDLTECQYCRDEPRDQPESIDRSYLEALQAEAAKNE